MKNRRKTTLEAMIDVNRAMRILLYEISKLTLFRKTISILRMIIKDKRK